MNDVVLEKIYALKEALNNDPRVVDLLKKEKAMEESEEVMVLSYRYSRAQDDYSDALKHYKEDSDEIKIYQRKLFEAKQILDAHPLVREYLKAYQEVRLMYEKIESVIILPFSSKVKCEEKK